MIQWADFKKVEIRVGTIIEAQVFEQANNPSYRLMIDFGPLGVKKSSAQITVLYTTEQLVGKQIMAVVNFPPKQIATMMSECLVLGVPQQNGAVVLMQPDQAVANGSLIA